ncbi:MAG: LmeA family phospholipid-binding protein [Fimbriimonadaceae bacterium]|nr:LmeA family phospholipid-binding protein [Fimbriimonadaceae bacterium]
MSKKARPSGSAEKVSIRLDYVKTPPGLIIDSLSITGDRISIFGDPFQASLPKPGEVVARISQDSIAHFLGYRDLGKVEELTISFSPGVIDIEAVVRVGVSISVEVQCGLKVESGTKVMAYVKSAKALGLAPTGVVQKIIDDINPLFETSMIPIPVTLTEVEVMHEAVELRGTFDLPESIVGG